MAFAGAPVDQATAAAAYAAPGELILAADLADELAVRLKLEALESYEALPPELDAEGQAFVRVAALVSPGPA